MSEYYDALASAVANLKPADQPARYTFYDRARRMVLQRLQSVDPPMADADIRTEMNAFNAAIRQLETDIIKPRRVQPPPAPPPQQAQPARPASPHAQERQPQKPAAPKVAPRPAAPSPPTPQRPSLEIPPEFVGEAVAEEEVAVAPAAEPGVFPAQSAPEAASQALGTQPDKSRRHAIAIVAAALVVGVLGAGAYALWGRSEKPSVRTTAQPSAAARTAAPSGSPTAGPSAAPRPVVREPERPTADGDNMPYILRRQLVYYRSTQPPGTWVISKSQNFLYVIRPNSTAMRYTIGLAPDVSDASGLFQVSRKDDADGRQIYLGDSKFRIRQANTPITIGRTSPGSGFQLVKDDFTDLYDRSEVGTRIVVAN